MRDWIDVVVKWGLEDAQYLMKKARVEMSWDGEDTEMQRKITGSIRKEFNAALQEIKKQNGLLGSEGEIDTLEINLIRKIACRHWLQELKSIAERRKVLGASKKINEAIKEVEKEIKNLLEEAEHIYMNNSALS